MASETVQLAPVIKSTTESIEALYFTLNGTPDLSNLFNELQTQLQAMRTLLRLLDMVPDTVALNTDIINLVEKFGDSCVPVRESIERVSQHDNPDWTVFRNGPEDTAAIVRKLRMYMASIVIGGLQDLESKRHISFSAQGWQEYEELVADARIAYKEHLDDLVKRVDAFEERSRSSQ